MELSNADGNASTAFSWRSAFVKGGCVNAFSSVTAARGCVTAARGWS